MKMASKRCVQLLVSVLLVIFNVNNVSTFSFDFRNYEWSFDTDSGLVSQMTSVVYPKNIGHWFGTENGIYSCIKFNGAIRILVPVLLPSGVSQTFIMDVPPDAITEGRCISDFFSILPIYETVNSISFQWQTPILDTNEVAENEFSIEFKHSTDESGNPVYIISKFFVSYYNAQFVPGADIKKIEQQVENLEFFPASTYNSFKCEHRQLNATTDLFHVYFYDVQWEAFGDFFFNDEFKVPFNSPNCPSIPNDDKDDTDGLEFWKVWLVSTIIVLIVSLVILALLFTATMYCLKHCLAQRDEGYETFA